MFQGFDDETPEISIATGDEIIALYKGREIDRNEIIELMEIRGFITSEDFGFYN